MADKYLVDVDSQKKIHVNFPSGRIGYYLLRTGAKNLDAPTFEERKKIFLLTIKDFLDGTISMDELSGLALKLWRYPVDIKTPEENELNDAIYAASELSFYVRKIPEVDTDGGNFVMFLSEVKQFFHDNFEKTF